ncbi:hypothetical protein R3P38DRAFT_2814636 [Favolaschia claudopus]|uniref:Uncharacterized protein n=1 Tax=Favolaschia claudopus TaxID=2862362 RepID=A0AAV9Z2S8_9AGAR
MWLSLLLSFLSPCSSLLNDNGEANSKGVAATISARVAGHLREKKPRRRAGKRCMWPVGWCKRVEGRGAARVLESLTVTLKEGEGDGDDNDNGESGAPPSDFNVIEERLYNSRRVARRDVTAECDDEKKSVEMGRRRDPMISRATADRRAAFQTPLSISIIHFDGDYDRHNVDEKKGKPAITSWCGAFNGHHEFMLHK